MQHLLLRVHLLSPAQNDCNSASRLPKNCEWTRPLNVMTNAHCWFGSDLPEQREFLRKTEVTKRP